MVVVLVLVVVVSEDRVTERSLAGSHADVTAQKRPDDSVGRRGVT